MIELSRRWFVFGSAAAIAAAMIKTPFAVAAPTPVLQPYRTRLISDWMFAPQVVDASSDGLVQLNIHIRGSVFHQSAMMTTRGIYRWRSREVLEQPCLLAGDAFSLEMVGGSGLGRAHLICHDKVDDGPRIDVVELWEWSPDGTAKVDVAYLHADNSLEARQQRATAVPLDDDDDSDWLDEEVEEA